MKVAVCFSGIPRGDVSRNIELYRKAFPFAHFFFSTWNGYSIPNEKFTTYQEPNSDHLEERISKANLPPIKQRQQRHGYKQIIGHSLQLLFDVPKEYDIIIKCRYDVMINPDLSWQSEIENACRDMVQGYRWVCSPDTDYDWEKFRSVNWYEGVFDQMIISRRKLLDIPNVFKLYQEGNLDPCEWGWKQVFGYHFIENQFGGLLRDPDYLLEEGV